MQSARTDTRYYTLDFWRGIACLLVVAFHSSFYLIENPKIAKPEGIGRLAYMAMDHAWVGVPMFFVISGYCITAACIGAARRGFKPGDYFLRRFRRIYPPYWIAIVMFLLLCGVLAITRLDWLLFDEIHPFKRPFSLSWVQWCGNLTLTEVWRPNVVGNEDVRFFLGVAWTLCYEEQFYLVCGLLMWLSPRHLFRNCLWVTVAIGLPILYQTATTGVGNHQSGFFFDGRWLEFACGIGVYYQIHHAGKNPALWKKHLLSGSLLIAFVFTLITWSIQKYGILEELFVSSFFAMLLIALFRFDRIWFSGKIWRGIWICGTMCYSFYLVHAMSVKVLSNLLFRAGIEGLWMTAFVTLPVCIVFAAALSWPFHCLVERRCLNTKPVDFDIIFSRNQDHAKSAYALPSPQSE
ncbi:MAG: acyltransferase [Verrucomicrobiota bacterium]